MGEVLRPREGERLCSEARTAPEITGDHPRATTTRSRLTRITRNLAGQAPPAGEDPPALKSRRRRRRLCPVGTHQARVPTGCRGTGMDRASPIVVHSRRPHKGVRYWLVTAG
ncbi:hypothetical protein DF268_20265 [Streptomyces sp. V2]|nr:hypothetical protein DF268_20265 [Streptomyces sp. V2]